jgi:DNA-binding MarR family transcriptional regulator
MDLARDADLPEELLTLLRFGDTVSEAHFRLVEIVGALHGDRHLANALRGVLRYVMSAGPKTVPEIAAWRATSRQFIQRIVDTLVADGLVSLEHNPQHKRSRLVTVTAQGRARVEAMIAKEASFLREGLLRSGASLAEVQAATEVIQRFISVIDTLLTDLNSGDPS